MSGLPARSPSLPQVVLFDLGGVLVQWDGARGLLALAGGRIDEDRARRFWLESRWVRALEMGRCAPGEFAAGVVAELGLACTPDAFLEAFASWDRGPLPGALALLDELRPRCTLACLSNNNAIHWDRLRAKTGLAHRFERAYLSHEIGRFKPDAAAYRHVVEDLQLAAGRILFLDDNPENVEGARAVGLQAVEVHGVDEARSALCARGLFGPCDPARRLSRS